MNTYNMCLGVNMITKTTHFLILAVFMALGTGTHGISQEVEILDQQKLLQNYHSAHRNYEKGKKNFDKGKLPKAEAEFLLCIDKMPEHAEARFYLARIAYSTERLIQALEWIEGAKRDYAVNAQLESIVEQQQRKEQLEMSRQEKMNRLRYLETQTTRNSRGEEQKIAAGENELTKIAEEISRLEEEADRPPTVNMEIPADYHYVHGNILLKLERIREAQALYEKAVEIDPEHGEAHNNLAAIFFSDQKYQEALEYLEKAESFGASIQPEFKQRLLDALKK